MTAEHEHDRSEMSYEQLEAIHLGASIARAYIETVDPETNEQFSHMVRSATANAETASEVILSLCHHIGHLVIIIAAPDGTWRPTCLMERASRTLETSLIAPTKTELAQNTSGKRGVVMTAIDMLVLDGFAEFDDTKRLRSVKPYREVKP